jgi:hypothetical protein
MEILPREMIEWIFSFIPRKGGDWFRVKLTCKRFQEISVKVFDPSENNNVLLFGLCIKGDVEKIVSLLKDEDIPGHGLHKIARGIYISQTEKQKGCPHDAGRYGTEHKEEIQELDVPLDNGKDPVRVQRMSVSGISIYNRPLKIPNIPDKEEETSTWREEGER